MLDRPPSRSLVLAPALGAALLATIAGAPEAAAQPMSFQLKNDVPQGRKPSLWVVAVEPVWNVRLSLVRDDGEEFVAGAPSLATGQKATLEIGDGRGGKATWKGTLSAEIAGEADGARKPWSYDLAFETLVRAPITVTWDHAHLDLERRTLRFQMSRPAGRAEIVAYDEEGQEIGRGEARYKREAPGAWLPIAWSAPPASAAPLMRLALRAESADKLATNAELVPWSVAIEHEDVTFPTASAEIRPEEAKKLDRSLEKIRDKAKRAERFVKVKLYVAGHTDTVGSAQSNRELSLRRARAIAEYFRDHGLAIPIVYEGFGEEVHKVRTEDGVDEAMNRRADYVLGAIGAQPPLPGGGWKSAR